ncbi:MAG: pyridoxamine 5'-phosphate oxidase family protein, partial [Bacteroidales bacterium]|nr:pyridoxamine 5'-phosphate oxidase family protein [Bacteroidales bacterium]
MEEKLDNKITEFIGNHHVLVLATCADNQPYCCDCFYAYDAERNTFIIKTDAENTRHMKEIAQNSNVAASIVLETKEVGKLQGLQICAKAVVPTDDYL